MAARARQILVFVLALAAYLCSGAAWNVWMVVRHPPVGPFTEAIQNRLAPYSSLPVGYALGPRFGRLAWALRIVAHASDNGPAALKEAENIERQLAESGGTWSDVATYALASLEETTGLPGHAGEQRSFTFILALDEQRWGRTTLQKSGTLEKAMDRYRALAANYPASPAAADALVRLAALEKDEWEFASSVTCRQAASILQPGRTAPSTDPLDRSTNPPPNLIALAAAYVKYLKASPAERKTLASELSGQALAAGDRELTRWLTGDPIGTSHPSNHSDEQSLSLSWLNRPVGGAHVAMLVASNLRTAALSQVAYAGQLQKQTHLSMSAISRNLDALNPARPDDPLHTAAAAILSPERAAPIVQRLPTARTESDGRASFGKLAGLPVGVALLVEDQNGPDVCLAPFYPSDRRLAVRFVPRVTVLPTQKSGQAPPTLRWQPYPGAAHYRVALALEPPWNGSGPAVALSPDWDRRVTWWQDGVRGTSTAMTAAGFTGPSPDLAHNGLWTGEIYRVIVTAEDSRGVALATSIGMVDHPEEFFSVEANWLGLRTDHSQAPARANLRQWRVRRPFFFRPRRNPAQRRPAPTIVSDPLEKVLEAARALAPAVTPGSSTQEADLTPVAAHSPEAVALTAWLSISTEGRGPIPLQDPYLRQFVENPAAAKGAGSLLPFGLPGGAPGGGPPAAMFP